MSLKSGGEWIASTGFIIFPQPNFFSLPRKTKPPSTQNYSESQKMSLFASITLFSLLSARGHSSFHLRRNEFGKCVIPWDTTLVELQKTKNKKLFKKTSNEWMDGWMDEWMNEFLKIARPFHLKMYDYILYFCQPNFYDFISIQWFLILHISRVTFRLKSKICKCSFFTKCLALINSEEI
jgi:hypothetical protein